MSNPSYLKYLALLQSTIRDLPDYSPNDENLVWDSIPQPRFNTGADEYIKAVICWRDAQRRRKNT